MKLQLPSLVLALLSLFMTSCLSGKSAQSQTDTDGTLSEDASAPDSEIAIPVEDAEEQSELNAKCAAYWAEWKKLHEEKADYFEKNILAKALANPQLPEQNRKFLLDLKVYLRQSDVERSKIVAPDQLLFPIFKLKADELGIFGFAQYDTANHESLDDISAESLLLSNQPDLPATEMEADPADIKIVYYKKIADAIFSNRSRAAYTFTSQKAVKTSILNFGVYGGECLQYYHYPIDAKLYSRTDEVLFGSKYNLALDYKNTPEADAILRTQAISECFDCPTSSAYEKTFANLKGVEGLYFSHADTFPLNNQLDTPSRALVMKMGNKMVYIWYQEVDLFGCSCL